MKNAHSPPKAFPRACACACVCILVCVQRRPRPGVGAGRGGPGRGGVRSGRGRGVAGAGEQGPCSAGSALALAPLALTRQPGGRSRAACSRSRARLGSGRIAGSRGHSPRHWRGVTCVRCACAGSRNRVPGIASPGETQKNAVYLVGTPLRGTTVWALEIIGRLTAGTEAQLCLAPGWGRSLVRGLTRAGSHWPAPTPVPRWSPCLPGGPGDRGRPLPRGDSVFLPQRHWAPCWPLPPVPMSRLCLWLPEFEGCTSGTWQ